MSDQDKRPMLAEEGSPPDQNKGGSGDQPKSIQHHVIECPKIGSINVYVQGTRSSSEVVILTVHDLGCDHTMYYDFVNHEAMATIRSRTVWVHVDVPGQSQDAPDLPANYEFPTMQKLGEDLIHVLDTLKIREVVCFGEGAGANILARFAIAHQKRCLGVVLLHCTGTTAGFMESMKDKLMNWKLDHGGMNPTAESYLVLHRFGSTHKSGQSMKAVIENYQSKLKNHVNPKNLKRFVESFLKRTNIADNCKKITCPVLFVAGAKSVFCTTTQQMHQMLMRNAADKGKIDLLVIAGCANVLEENPRKFIESLQYFLQGLGLVSSIPMQKRMSFERSSSMEECDLPLSVRRKRTTSLGTVSSIPMHHLRQMSRMRSMSMEEYDMPKIARQRQVSGGNTGTASPLASSTPPQQVVN